MEPRSATGAIVREVPDSFGRAIKPRGSSDLIDVERARRQHRLYCEELERTGLSLIRIAADDSYPDCCFIEDTAVVVGARAIIARPGADSRRGETAAIAHAFPTLLDVFEIQPPATLDGGDVLTIGKRLYVGMSNRTNREAVPQLQQILALEGYEVVPVEVHDALHLKSACTYLGGDTIVWRPGSIDQPPFAHLHKITVSEEERHAANCLSVNGTVLVPAGAPRTRTMIEAAGYNTVELDISESRKAAGGLTCSSIVF
jgi:dimethylargininase